MTSRVSALQGAKVVCTNASVPLVGIDETLFERIVRQHLLIDSSNQSSNQLVCGVWKADACNRLDSHINALNAALRHENVSDLGGHQIPRAYGRVLMYWRWQPPSAHHFY